MQQDRLTVEAIAAARRVSALGEELGRPAGEVALRWVLGHPAVTCALIGPRTMAQWQEALSAATWELPADLYERLSAPQG